MSTNKFQQTVAYWSHRIYQSFINLPLVSKSLIVLIALFYFLQLLTDMSGLILQHLGANFNPLQLVTYFLLEFYFFNALFSIVALWLFSAPIESYWGQKRFLIYLAMAILSAACIHLLIGNLYLLGPTGIIYCLLLAYGMMWPEQRIQLLLPPIPVKGKYLVLVFGILMALSLLQTSWGRWALLTYLGSAFCCFLLIQFWRHKPPFNKQKKSHLKRIK